MGIGDISVLFSLIQLTKFQEKFMHSSLSIFVKLFLKCARLSLYFRVFKTIKCIQREFFMEIWRG